MVETIFNSICLLTGIGIAIAGVYFLSKDKNEQDSKKIYSIFILVGIIIFPVYESKFSYTVSSIILHWENLYVQ